MFALVRGFTRATTDGPWDRHPSVVFLGVRVLQGGRTRAKKVAFPCVLRDGRGPLESEPRFIMASELREKVTPYRGKQVVLGKSRLGPQGVDDGQPGRWALGHRDGHASIELHDRRRRHVRQNGVEP